MHYVQNLRKNYRAALFEKQNIFHFYMKEKKRQITFIFNKIF
jgi:hypothetical protein